MILNIFSNINYSFPAACGSHTLVGGKSVVLGVRSGREEINWNAHFLSLVSSGAGGGRGVSKMEFHVCFSAPDSVLIGNQLN